MSVGDFPVGGRIVAITGGGSGIHLELAKLVHARGAKVVIADLKLSDEAERLVDGSKVVFVETNVANWADLQSIIKLLGDVPDIYVAGAGIFEPPWSNFWDDTEETAYAAVQINVNHPLKLTRIATRALVGANKKGVVLIMASMAGYSGNFSAPMYSTTKHALIGFTRSIGDLDAHEGVKVVTICPGIVNTPLWSTNPAASARFGYHESISISAQAVAEAELELIESRQFPGGTVYEISQAGRRTIPTWFVAPPGHDPAKPTEGIAVPPEAIERANAPIWERLAAERGI
ncbi:hypothetical protein BJY00DRAFT_323979 [Aspergillus carlsbadensis]|nr:hypothetical protein BJY00DRAFT_323979 [Aspergillus carlsbadensis]